MSANRVSLTGPPTARTAKTMTNARLALTTASSPWSAGTHPYAFIHRSFSSLFVLTFLEFLLLAYLFLSFLPSPVLTQCRARSSVLSRAIPATTIPARRPTTASPTQSAVSVPTVKTKFSFFRRRFPRLYATLPNPNPTRQATAGPTAPKLTLATASGAPTPAKSASSPLGPGLASAATAMS